MLSTKKIFVFVAALVVILMTVGMIEAARLPKTFPKFSTENLNGDIVTNEIFWKNDVTMINFWATWCPPCVAEMPDLAKLDGILGDMDESVGLIGILIDADGRGAIQQAEKILNNAKANFPQLRPNGEMRGLLGAISAIPTSIFVDPSGNIVGPTMVGANSAEGYLAGFRDALKEINRK